MENLSIIIEEINKISLFHKKTIAFNQSVGRLKTTLHF